MVNFIIVRHGYSRGNKEKRFSGQMNVPLDDVGLRQAQAVSDYIAENFCVDCIYSSDLSRAFDTVKPLSQRLGIDIITDAGLRECDVGKWQGMLIEDVKDVFPESFELYRKCPGLARFDGGESYEELMLRAKETFERIARDNDGKSIVIGTHGGVIRTLRAAWDGIPLVRIGEIPHVPNASVTVACYDSGRIEWQRIGYCDYLTDKTTEEGVK